MTCLAVFIAIVGAASLAALSFTPEERRRFRHPPRKQNGDQVMTTKRFTITSITDITELLGFPTPGVKRYTAESDDGRTIIHLHVRGGQNPVTRLEEYTGATVIYAADRMFTPDEIRQANFPPE